MADNFTLEFLKQPREENIKKSSVISSEKFKPDTTKYRLVDGQKEYNYQREPLLPSLDDSQIVLQSTFSKAGGDTGKRFIESSGAGPCVIATLYDSESKTGMMVHFDNRSNVTLALREMKKELGGDSSKWQMRIFGGHKSEESSKKIIKEIRDSALFSAILITEEDILMDGSDIKSVNIVMDTETGKVYDLPTDESKRFSQFQSKLLGQKQDEILHDPRVTLGEVKFIKNILEP